MVVILQQNRGFAGGLLVAIGAWVIIMAARADLIETFPATNQYILGGAIIFIAWLIGRAR